MRYFLILLSGILIVGCATERTEKQWSDYFALATPMELCSEDRKIIRKMFPNDKSKRIKKEIARRGINCREVLFPLPPEKKTLAEVLDEYIGKEIESGQRALGYRYVMNPLKHNKIAYTWVQPKSIVLYDAIYKVDCEITLIAQNDIIVDYWAKGCGQ